MTKDVKTFNDVILVRSKLLAAALFASGYRAQMAYEDTNDNFYCTFAITRKLRKDIRRLYTGDSSVNVLQLEEELADINIYLAEYEGFVQAKLRDVYPAPGN